MNIIVPMAGKGSRFNSAGFDLPKALINVAGKAMYRYSIDGLPLNLVTKLIFIIKKNNFSQTLEEDIEKHYGSYPYSIIILENDTQGQAETILKAAAEIDLNLPTLIHNCDTYIATGVDWQQLIKEKIDGAIFLFESNEDRWSYVKLDKRGLTIIDIQEKKIISTHATTGTYYFKDSVELLKNIQKIIDQNLKTNNEYYLSSVYHLMLKQNKVILPMWVEDILCFGTPQDLVKSLNRMIMDLKLT